MAWIRNIWRCPGCGKLSREIGMPRWVLARRVAVCNRCATVFPKKIDQKKKPS